MAFINSDSTSKSGYNVFSFFKNDSDYFSPGEKKVMLNFAVKDLFGLLDILREEGVSIVGEPMDDEYGKFGWITDPEGNKIDWWEPVLSA